MAMSFVKAEKQRIETPIDEDLPVWTISSWANGTAAPTTAPSGQETKIINKGSNYEINWDHASSSFRNNIIARISGTYYGAALNCTSGGVWYHLAGTFDGTNLRAYRDGNLITTTNAPGTPNYNTYTARIAHHETNNNVQGFGGYIDDVRIYNRPLSDNEIKTMFTLRGHDNIVHGLLHRFTMIERNIGITASDASSVVDVSGKENGSPFSYTGTLPTYTDSILSLRRLA